MRPLSMALAAAAFLCPLARAATMFTFDGADTTSVTGTPLGTSVTISNAYYETEDGNGDPLAMPGFRADPNSPLPTIGDPATGGYGPAISGLALDGTGGPVMFTFASAMNLLDFGVVLDNSGFGTIQQSGGDPANGTNILFYDSADNLIGFIALDQTVPGFTITNDPGVYSNVSKIILPGGAYYDNLSFTAQAVPEPSAIALAGLGALALLKRRRA